MVEDLLAAKYAEILPHLDERQRRRLLGAEARALGHGGIRVVARAAGAQEATVSAGASELAAGAEPLGRARRPGGGRQRAAVVDPGLVPALPALVEPEERGGPVSPLRWTVKSTRTLAAGLTGRGHRVSAGTAGVPRRGQGSACRGSKHVTQIRGLIAQTGHTIHPATRTLTTVHDLCIHAAESGITIPATINTAC